jgi:hypothetical protein
VGDEPCSCRLANRQGVKIPHQSSIEVLKKKGSIEVCRPQLEQHSATGADSILVLGFLWERET